MKISITCPGFVPHGGIRIILEWANRLEVLGHKVSIYCKSPGYPDWFNLSKSIHIYNSYMAIDDSDLLIISSPHDIRLANRKGAKKKLLFLQMLEHLFMPENSRWQHKCFQFYGSVLPLVSISGWNMDYIKQNFPQRGSMFYVGNGVNTVDFPITEYEDDCKTILVEGWNAINPSKDSKKISHSVAKYLKQKYNSKIVAYGQTKIEDDKSIVDEYFKLPNIHQLNDLYSRASFLLKASVYDARSCSPMEAMTKGTPTLRAINKGDDDLIDGYNCIRVGYNLDELISGADSIQNKRFRNFLSNNCLEHINKYSWNYWMPIINKIITTV